jgi:hypothetical protein
MQQSNISARTVICQASEDETAVVPEVRWSQGKDVLIGFCGKVGANHKCDPHGVVVSLKDGDEDQTVYEQMVGAFEDYRIGWYGRVIMINPLCAELPAVAVLFQPTCNKFDADFVRQQWDDVDKYWQQVDGHSKVGMLIGHGSDGDSRRRKLMLADYTRLLPQAECFTLPNCPGFTLVARVNAQGLVSGLHSQDSIHNGKKGINPLDSPHRRLVIGKYMATIQHLHAVFGAYEPHVHGMQLSDIERKDRQNWPACQRLMFRKVRTCLMEMAASAAHSYLKTQATSAYLEVSNYCRAKRFSLSRCTQACIWRPRSE